MIRKNCLWAILGICGSLLVVAVPTATQAAEPEAPHASAWDAKVVCHRVKTPGSRTREKECATRAEWRARGIPDRSRTFYSHDRPLGPRKLNGSRGSSPAVPGSYSHASPGTSPVVPGNTNFGTVASQSSFQR